MMMKRGVSFVEVLIAMVVIGLAMFPILSVMSSSHGDTRSTMEEVVASNLASELLEAVQSLPYELVPVNIDTETQAGTFAAAEGAGYQVCLASPPAGFKRFLKTTTLAVESSVASTLPRGVQDRAATAAVMLKIRALVQWTTRGRPESVHLETARGRF